MSNNTRWAIGAAWLVLGCLPGCLSVRAAEPKPPKPPKAPPPVAAKRAANPRQQQKAFEQQAARRTQAQAANKEARAAQMSLNAPRLMQLAQMTPEERATALAKLRPEQRERLEQGLDNFSKLPPDQQARTLSQYQKMEALTPEKREQVRESLTQYNNIPPPRKGVIRQEMIRLSTMSPEFRADYMSKPAFRRQYSEEEIRMMNDLNGIVP